MNTEGQFTCKVLKMLLYLLATFSFVCASALGLGYWNPTVSENIGELSRKKCVEFYPQPPPPGIAGGVKSLPKEFPHMAALGVRNETSDGNNTEIMWLCGGSLISKQFILTAAHCLRKSPINVVRLGDLDLASDTDQTQPQTFGVKRKILHPEYAFPKKYHDIALIELDGSIRTTLYVAPACLYTKKQIPKTMTATGWGKTGFTAKYSTYLLKVDLNHVEHSNCSVQFRKDRYLPEGIQNDSQICAGGVQGKDTCLGDSGGPLQLKKHRFSSVINVHDVVGVTSFGKACNVTESPGIFTNVFHYLPWIEKNVWPNEH